MALVKRFRRYRSADVTSPSRFDSEIEIAFIIARYDDGAIPPAIFAVLQRLRAKAARLAPLPTGNDAAPGIPAALDDLMPGDRDGTANA